MSIQNKILKFSTIISLMFATSGCIVLDIKGAGVFKDPIKYNNRDYTYIDIPAGTDSQNKDISAGDGSKIGFGYLGRCGRGISVFGIMIPIIPWVLFNECEERGFFVQSGHYLDEIGVTVQLKYNNKIHNSYFDFEDNGSIKFKIENFSTFKEAKDKSLIIHKKKPDGTMWSKELPFDWKIVTEVSGGL